MLSQCSSPNLQSTFTISSSQPTKCKVPCPIFSPTIVLLSLHHCIIIGYNIIKILCIYSVRVYMSFMWTMKPKHKNCKMKHMCSMSKSINSFSNVDRHNADQNFFKCESKNHRTKGSRVHLRAQENFWEAMQMAWSVVQLEAFSHNFIHHNNGCHFTPFWTN